MTHQSSPPRQTDWLLQKRQNVSMVNIHLRNSCGFMYCPGHAGMNGHDRADRLAGKATFTRRLLLGRSEVLRSLRHYLQAQSQGHHINGRLEERGVKGGSVTIFLERTREGHRQSDKHWNYFKGNVGVTSERRDGAHINI